MGHQTKLAQTQKERPVSKVKETVITNEMK